MEQDLENGLLQLSKKIEQNQQYLTNEEITKTSAILPFFQTLGYDVFNPREFVSELTSDFGCKKGEKVDYAIMKNDEPIVLIEVKPFNDPLCKDKHGAQLFRYFSTTSAKIGVLTNGRIYRFFSDLENQNKMDDRPFYEFDILNIKKNDIKQLKKYAKNAFNIDDILAMAEELRYKGLLKKVLIEQFNSPSEQFISFLLKNDIYDKKITQPVLAKFKPLVKESVEEILKEEVDEVLKSALAKKDNSQEESNNEVADVKVDKISEIVTTEDEIGAFYIIKSLLSDIIDPSRLSYRDTSNYCNIIVDGKVTRWVCRLYFNSNRKSIQFPEQIASERIELKNVESIHDLKVQIISAAEKCL